METLLRVVWALADMPWWVGVVLLSCGCAGLVLLWEELQ